MLLLWLLLAKPLAQGYIGEFIFIKFILFLVLLIFANCTGFLPRCCLNPWCVSKFLMVEQMKTSGPELLMTFDTSVTRFLATSGSYVTSGTTRISFSSVFFVHSLMTFLCGTNIWASQWWTETVSDWSLHKKTHQTRMDPSSSEGVNSQLFFYTQYSMWNTLINTNTVRTSDINLTCSDDDVRPNLL